MHGTGYAIKVGDKLIGYNYNLVDNPAQAKFYVNEQRAKDAVARYSRLRTFADAQVVQVEVTVHYL